MTKPSKVNRALFNAQSVEPVSISDAGQMAARAGDSLSKVATWCGTHIANFPANVASEDRAAFKTGVWVHYQTVKPAVYFRREGKNLIRLTDKPDKPDKLGPDHVKLDVAFCTGLTGQYVGGLKTTDPELYKEVTAYRDECNKYAANRWGAVVRFHHALTATSKPRGASKSFKDKMGEVFDTMAKSAKVAKTARGDVTAPEPDKFKAAVKAFWAALAS
jgi:hypothetical protein